MSSVRRERLQEQLVREISDIIQNRLKDPRRGMMSVTRVDLSGDLRHARVYVSVLGDTEQKQSGMRTLERAANFIRGRLGRSLHVRHAPELRFRLDESLEASQRIMEILDGLEIPPAAEDEEGAGPEGGAGKPDESDSSRDATRRAGPDREEEA
ncbi:MAG: 30S ribosome-binding factor RbfA [Candidatus Eisenbacteria bacterium]|nr:30S ribosome-binding factor RbfA [Candidatus Eisenbacteria bacterium]